MKTPMLARRSEVSSKSEFLGALPDCGLRGGLAVLGLAAGKHEPLGPRLTYREDAAFRVAEHDGADDDVWHSFSHLVSDPFSHA